MPATESLPPSGFRGIVRIRTWFGGYIAPHWPWPFGTPRPDYSSNAYDWQILPSRHGGYWIRTPHGPSFTYWQTDMRDAERKLVLHPGADDWETFFVEAHPSGGYAIRSYANQMKYVSAEPEDHGIHLIANRPGPAGWEQFQIDVLAADIPGPHGPTPVVRPFICQNCGRVLDYCNGGVAGDRHVLASDPFGNYPCRFCGKTFYEISHTHI